jgi:hypothetical protein
MNKAKNYKILLGMTADVLPIVLEFHHEQICTHCVRTLHP